MPILSAEIWNKLPSSFSKKYCLLRVGDLQFLQVLLKSFLSYLIILTFLIIRWFLNFESSRDQKETGLAIFSKFVAENNIVMPKPPAHLYFWSLRYKLVYYSVFLLDNCSRCSRKWNTWNWSWLFVSRWKNNVCRWIFGYYVERVFYFQGIFFFKSLFLISQLQRIISWRSYLCLPWADFIGEREKSLENCLPKLSDFKMCYSTMSENWE